MKIYIKGLNSCTQRKTNIAQYDDFLRGKGHTIVDTPEQSDLILLWSCGFRDDYRRYSLDTIQSFLQYQKRVIVCGCLPAIDAEALAALGVETYPWTDKERMANLFGGTQSELDSAAMPLGEPPLHLPIESFKQNFPDKIVSFRDQWIKVYIGEGCAYNCSYCSEKLAFPKLKSFPTEKIIESCRVLIQRHNCYRITLLSDCLGNYGLDTNLTLLDLVKEILSIDPRIELGLENLNPADFMNHFDAFMDIVKQNKVFTFSVPIQSTCDRLLKLMNRPYSSLDIQRIFCALRDSGFKELVTHLIVGFPTETDAEFFQTIDAVVSYAPKYVMLSKYLETSAMESSKIFPKVSDAVIRDRQARAIEALSSRKIICTYDDCSYMEEKFSQNHIYINKNMEFTNL